MHYDVRHSAGHWVFSGEEKGLEKNDAFHDETTCSKLRIERNFFNLIKNIYQNPTTVIILDGE